MSPTDPHFKEKLIRGVGHLFILQIAMRVVSLAGHVFLARLLLPSDFGVYGVAIFIVGFSLSLFNQGLPAAILQKKEKTEGLELDTLFTLQQLLALLIYGTIWVLAPWVARYYGSAAITPLYIRVFSVSLVLMSLKSFAFVQLERELNFKWTAIIEFVGVLSFQVITVFLAWKGLGAWSFLWGVVLSRVAMLILAFWVSGHLPRFGHQWRLVRNIFRFGFFVQLGGITNLLRDALIPVYLGHTIGVEAVGFVNWAWTLCNYPLVAVNALEKTSFASLSRIQDQKERFRNLLETLLKMNNIIVMGLLALLVSQADFIVHYVFTDKWAPAVPLIYAFSVNMLLFGGGNILSSAVLALGGSRFTFLFSFWIFVYLWSVGMFLIERHGMIGYGYAMALNGLNAFVQMFYVRRIISFSIVKVTLPPLLTAVATCGGAYFLSHSVFTRSVGGFVGAVLCGTVFYGLVTWVWHKKEIQSLARDVSKSLAK